MAALFIGGVFLVGAASVALGYWLGGRRYQPPPYDDSPAR